MHKDAIYVYHLGPLDMRLRNSDGRIVELGVTYTTPNPSRPVEPCVYGFHGSQYILDALNYASGPMLTLREIWGELREHGKPVDKHCARNMIAVQAADFTPWSRLFARWCALSVVHLWDAPEVVLRYLLTGDEAIRNAAGNAAWDAAWAAGNAAWDAAWAAGNAAWDAAWAAGDVAGAAGAAAWAAGAAGAAGAAWAAGDVAGAAGAARDASWAAQLRQLDAYAQSALAGETCPVLLALPEAARQKYGEVQYA